MEIQLTQGKVALVDDEDAGRVLDAADPRWRATRSDDGRRWYAVTGQRHAKRLMHRIVLGLPGRVPHVDHVNGDGLDNHRANLRLATVSQNMANASSRGGSSRFKGVTLFKPTGRWMAQITVRGKRMYLGYYATQEEAAAAYDAAAFRAFGGFAKTNALTDEETPACRACGWSQVGRIERDTCPYCGQVFDWVEA